MPHYAHIKDGRLNGIAYYSTPPVGYHSALAAQRLAEYEALLSLTAPEEQPKFALGLQMLKDELANLRKSEAEFAARLAGEGLELREIPGGEDLGAIYEEVDPRKPERGVRVRPAFEAKAKTWPRLGSKPGELSTDVVR